MVKIMVTAVMVSAGSLAAQVSRKTISASTVVYKLSSSSASRTTDGFRAWSRYFPSLAVFRKAINSNTSFLVLKRFFDIYLDTYIAVLVDGRAESLP